MSGYRTQAKDTSVEAERVLIERYRAMSPAQKIAIARGLSRMAHQVAMAGARLRHPDASPEELRLRVAATRLPPETMAAAFGWSPNHR